MQRNYLEEKKSLLFSQSDEVDERQHIANLQYAEAKFKRKSKKSRGRRIAKALFRILTLAVLVTLSLHFSKVFGKYFNRGPISTGEDKTKPFEWDDVKPSKQLNWVPCYTHVEATNVCARLTLPLDPLNSSDAREVHLAIMKVPATVDVTSKRYGGMFVDHPGGPGQTGTSIYERLEFSAKQTRDLVSDEEGGGLVYDFITLDPRGTGASRPIFRDFKSQQARDEWGIETRDVAENLHLESNMKKFIAKDKAFGLSLREELLDESSVGKYVGTVSAVRDLLGLAAAHAEWRENEAKRILSGDELLSSDERAEVLERTKNKGDEELLNIIGVSYGSAVAQYFASMYPFRYDRMIIDAVMDVNEWSTATWVDTPPRIEEITGIFAEECFAAGQKCHLYDSSGPNGTLNKFYGLLEQVRTEGPLIGMVDDAPVKVSLPELAEYVRSSYYTPQIMFKDLDYTIWAAINGNLEPLVRGRSTLTCPKATVKPEDYAGGGFGVMCMDSTIESWEAYVQPETFKKYLNEHIKRSKYMGPGMFGNVGAHSCLQLKGIDVPSHLRFSGPFGIPEGTVNKHGKKPNNILFASSKDDVICPLENARAMRKIFPGSGLLVNAGPAHSSRKWRSKCIEAQWKKYWQTGEVDPDNEVWCEKEGHADWDRSKKSASVFRSSSVGPRYFS